MINANNLIQLDGYIQNISPKGNQTFFNMKVKRNYKNTNDQNEKVYFTDIVPCKISGPSQEYVENYITDGQKIKALGSMESYKQTIIDGKLQSFDAEKGPTIYRQIVSVETIQSQESKEKAMERMETFKNKDITDKQNREIASAEGENISSTTIPQKNDSYQDKQETEFDADDYFPS